MTNTRKLGADHRPYPEIRADGDNVGRKPEPGYHPQNESIQTYLGDTIYSEKVGE